MSKHFSPIIKSNGTLNFHIVECENEISVFDRKRKIEAQIQSTLAALDTNAFKPSEKYGSNTYLKKRLLVITLPAM